VRPRVLITGASGGIGAAAVQLLRERGAAVVGLDLRGDGEQVLECDVRDQASVDRGVAAAIERLDGLDVLVNCAGVGDPQSAGERPGDDALRVLDVNMVGPWRVTAAALPALRDSRGRVLNVASGLSHLALPLAPAYCMSKRGLVAYSDALRLEHGDAITVTTIYPGYVRTGIHSASEALGVSLEAWVPAESLKSAASAIVRAALDRPARDLATTRRGSIGYALLRIAPRRLIDRLVGGRMRRGAARGGFESSGLAEDLRARLLAR
jgi:NAD(P)-dependent dehydrogenase (short-subunit alcohol dehydrogenase family)